MLPDLLRPGLNIVFCGTAAGAVSAKLGAYYAHPQNKFWRTLFEIGLTPRLLEPGEFPRLLEYGVGLTDIAKTASGMDAQLPRGALGLEARAALKSKIMAVQPKILAFTSLAAGRACLGRTARFGEQQERIAQTRIWVLPSPSPAARWNWSENAAWWRRLGAAFAGQRAEVP